MLGSPVVEVVDLLSSGLSQSRPVIVATAQPHPHTYTSTPPAPPPASVSVVEISESSPVPAVATIESKSDEEILTAPPKTKVSDLSALVSKCHHISTTLISLSISTMSSTSSITSFPVVPVPELVIPAEAYPEHLNRPDGEQITLLLVSLYTFSFGFHLDSCQETCGCYNKVSCLQQGISDHGMPPQTWQGHS